MADDASIVPAQTVEKYFKCQRVVSYFLLLHNHKKLLAIYKYQ